MKSKNSKTCRFLSVLLSLLICVSFMPAAAFAEGETGVEAPVAAQEESTEAVESEAAGAEAAESDAAEAEAVESEEAELSEDVVDESAGSEAVAADTTCEHQLEIVEAVEATCQHTGVKAHRKCTKCGALFDLIDSKEVTEDSLIIPIADHKWEKTSVDGTKTTYTCSVCGATKTEEGPATAKSFTLDDNKLKFSKAVVKTVPKSMKNSQITSFRVRGFKSKMKVYWENAKNMDMVDGVIILRRTGTSKIYKEVKRIAFRKESDGSVTYDPKTAYNDKTAKTKNTPYTYVIVAYHVDNGYTYISHCSPWAAGQTTPSKLKSVYKAKINQSSVKLQVNGTTTLKATYSSPKTTYNAKSFRWSSDNTSIVKVNSKGKIRGVGVGTTTVRCKLSTGYEVTSKVKVVGAFTPPAPTLKVDVADNTSITLIWNKVKNADYYHLYHSDDGLHWKDPVKVSGTTKKVTGLTKGHRYTFYVTAVNKNESSYGTYTAESKNSNVLNQKAVIKRRPSSLTGWPTSKSLRSGDTFSVTVKISNPAGRKAKLQMYNGKKWVAKKYVTLPKGTGTNSVTITFPNDWWGSTTKWRFVIPKNTTTDGVTTKTLKISAARKYQNPSSYIQINDTISKHGYSYYVCKVLVDSTSTKSDHIEALIKTANKFKGDKYVNGNSGAPGKGIDASGLVIQACYGAGVDLWPISPSTRPSNCVPKLMSSKLKTIKYTSDHANMTRGDLIFFETVEDYYGHVAIYLGYGKIIHASPVTEKVEISTIDDTSKALSDKYKNTKVSKTIQVRRIFN